MRSGIYGVMSVAISALCLTFLAACAAGSNSSTNATPPATKTTPAISQTTATAAKTATPIVGVSSRGTMSAKIDGAGWTAIAVSTATYSNRGIISIGGADGSNPPRAMSFAMVASGPGTYQIGQVDQSGANALMMTGSSAWQANVVSGSGTLTVSTLTSSGASGTFAFTMNAAPNNSASGTKVITDGAFNVTFSSSAVIATPTP